ncbi:unnamed protein product [Hydatigera taeniaeformis]|uniref:Fibronectin type-III domain-containing protein n=1 Tax=Hydatigena taeniaeformis TaxID=6205 RepID=A0A0R3WVB5_HYDTA|nr:unnamed protein product [Hydatigera taeniaeformis]
MAALASATEKGDKEEEVEEEEENSIDVAKDEEVQEEEEEEEGVFVVFRSEVVPFVKHSINVYTSALQVDMEACHAPPLPSPNMAISLARQRSPVTEDYDSILNISATPLGPNSISVSWDVDEMKARQVSILLAIATQVPDTVGIVVALANVGDGIALIEDLDPSTTYKVKVVGLENIWIEGDEEENDDDEPLQEVRDGDEGEDVEEDYEFKSEVFEWTNIVETLPQGELHLACMHCLVHPST